MNNIQEDRLKAEIRILSIVQNASLGAFITGYTGAELSFSFNAVKENLNLDKDAQFYNILFTLSIILGSFLGTILYSQLHQISTKRIIMVMADLIFIASVTFRFDTWEAFALQRLLKGIANGLNLCAGLLYIREMSPDYLSHKSICIFQININMGIVLANLISIPLANNIKESSNGSNQNGQLTSSQYWKFVFCFPLLISLIRAYVLIFIFNFDTPFSYYQQNEIAKGQKCLKKLFFSDECQIEFENYKNYIEQESPTFSQRWKIAVFVLAIQQFSGINSIIQQSNQSIIQFSSTSLSSQILQLFMNLILLFMAFLTYYNINKYNKFQIKQMMVGGCIILGLSLILMVVLNKVDLNLVYQILNLGVYFFIFNSTIGPITLIFISDICKDTSISRGFYSYWFSYMISTGLQLTNFEYVPIFFALACFIGASYHSQKFYSTKNITFFKINNNQIFEQNDQ